MQRKREFTKSVAELFKVDEAVLILVDQAEDPEGEGALVGAKSPRLQQGEEHAELLKTQLVLLQISQAGVMMEESWTLHRPVAAEKMLPLTNKQKKKHVCISLFFKYYNIFVFVSCLRLTLNKL